MPEDAQLNTDLATVEYNDLQVKAEGYNALDTASHSPLGEPVPPAVLTLSASSLLDKLLARTRTVHRKLDKMTIQATKRKSMSCTPPKRKCMSRSTITPACRPGAVLDRCLAQSQELLNKVDKLSTEVVAGSPITHQVQVCTNKTRDASAYLPIGRVGPLVAGSLQVAETTQTGEQCAAVRHLAAETTHPIIHQVQVSTNKARDASDCLPTGSVATGQLAAEPTDADHPRGQGTTDQNPTREASTIKVVTATDYSAQLAGVTFGQHADLADEDRSARKADTIKVVTATDSPAQLEEVTIGQHAHLADEDSSAQKADTILATEVVTAVNYPAELGGVKPGQSARHADSTSAQKEDTRRRDDTTSTAPNKTISLHAAGSRQINLHLTSPKTQANGNRGPGGLTKQHYLGKNDQQTILHQQHQELATLTASCGATNTTGNISTWDKPVH